MNSPSCPIPACQPARPGHHRRNNAIPPAYALVVDSAPSRPNRTCRRNESAAATTARSSSSTVQYPPRTATSQETPASLIPPISR